MSPSGPEAEAEGCASWGRSIWCHFGLDHPAEWELLQFTRNPERGRCAFADRYAFRLELSWRTTPAAPDFDRMLSDYEAQLGTQGMEDVTNVRHGEWRGLAGHLSGIEHTRYGRFFPSRSRLLEVVFLWPAGRDLAIEQRVLGSVVEEPLSPEQPSRWRVFGMDIRVDPRASLQACTQQAARAELTFVSDGPAWCQRFMRLGMVSEWLKGPVSDWAVTQMPGDIVPISVTSDHAQGHEVVRIQGAAHRVRRLLPLARTYRAEAWQCPADNRLYLASWLGRLPRTEKPWQGFGHSLCCSDLAGATEWAEPREAPDA